MDPYEPLMRNAGVPKDVLRPAGLHADRRGLLHVPGCRESAGGRSWRRKSSLNACRCTNDTLLGDGWGSCLDLRVIALLLAATKQAQKSRGATQKMERALYLQERLSYGEGVIRVTTSKTLPQAPKLAAVARTACNDAAHTLAGLLTGLRSPRGRAEVDAALGAERDELFEVLHPSGPTRAPHLGFRGGEAALTLETRSVATRPGAVLVAASRSARAAVEREAVRYTIGSNGNEPAYTITRLGQPPNAVRETLATLYEETDTETLELLRTAELLVQE